MARPVLTIRLVRRLVFVALAVGLLGLAAAAVAQSASRSYFSINFVWVLIAGFLVIFMQAGFALVETGLIRAKNAAHTMSMNFCVYALGMFGFFVSGFALMCGGA